ncbi:hypothetical protein ABEF95_008062 [Exophiala dermatitidis]
MLAYHNNRSWKNVRMVLSPPSTLSNDAIREALGLYPSLVEKVYRSKLKDPKKISDAIERDRWRYEGLPGAIALLKSETKHEDDVGSSSADVAEGALTKEALERLVQWKITHGHSRPFLPAMVRKNDPASVQTQTKLAWAKLSTSEEGKEPPTSTVSAALDLVCKLTGIGPATGTLILNVYEPVHIPFFQDEMFMWFFPATKSEKLKYTQKEYVQLLGAVGPVLKKLGIKAVELEKVSYVLAHLDVLEPSQRNALEAALKSPDQASGSEASEQEKDHEDDGSSDRKPGNQLGTKKESKRDASEADIADNKQEQPPKRRSRRNK